MPKKRTTPEKTSPLPEPIKPVMDMDEVDRRSRELGWTIVDEKEESTEINTLATAAGRSCSRKESSGGVVLSNSEEG
jgi:hypothetical protein